MKEFNTEAVCIPELHYMVDISDKIRQIEKLIAHGDYFTINRARQYGKTTTISTLFRKLKDKYLMIRLSFEGMGNVCFENDYNFVFNFQSIMYKGLKRAKASQEILDDWETNTNIPKHKDPFDYLSEKITTLCEMSDKEIATMLQEYESDHHTGMDITSLSEEIYKYTNGYPYLVSWLCKWMEKNTPYAWNASSVQLAIKGILNSRNNTLFDSLRNNIENNAQLKDLIFRILYEGESFMYNHANPVIELGEMFGIFINKNDYVAISNKIFEIYLYNYSISGL